MPAIPVRMKTLYAALGRRAGTTLADTFQLITTVETIGGDTVQSWRRLR